MRGWIVLAQILGLAISTAKAGDFETEKLNNWHHWRGPLATGVAPKGDPPTNWDDKTNIKWKAELVGKGSATPIVWGDRVFVVTAMATDRKAEPDKLPKSDPRFEKKTTAPETYHQFIVMCFDRNTGKPLWKKIATEQIPHEGTHFTHSYAAGSPTTDGKLLYVSFGSFGVFAYDFDGILKWTKEYGKMHTRLGWGEAVTPVVHGDSLLLNWDQEVDSSLICVDAKTGETKWRKPREEKTSWNTPLVVEHAGKTQVILNGSNRVRSYDLADGKVIWEVAGMTTNAIPSPVVKDGIAYIMSGYRGAAAVAVPLNSTNDLKDNGKVAWRYAKGTPYVPSPLLLGDRLWFTQANTQVLTILDIKSGKPVLDQERLPTVKSFYSSPAAAAGRVYLTDRDGITLVLKDSNKLEVLATNRLDDTIDASPAIVGKQLFLRGQKYLYCLEGK
ncbi:MAG: PQQ-like beta-propeller repeat protein [Planctomycetes bacterium]|nr:PQQ-like beta-propeller repeat protein [Planctomycetota bacterium]